MRSLALILALQLALPQSALRAFAADEVIPPPPQFKRSSPRSSQARPLTTSPLNRYQDETAEIPKVPSAPTVARPRTVQDSFHCERYVLLGDQKLACDSNVRRDGEKLRTFFESTPLALAEIDIYQRNLMRARSSAYLGSLGLVLAIAGFFVSQRFADNNGTLSNTGRVLQNTFILGGLGLSVGSFVFGYSFIRSNEAHLSRAVQHYNDAHPNAPMELQFSTGFSF